MIETNLPVLLLKELILLPFNEIRIEISKEEDKKVLNIYTYSTKTRKALIQVLSLFFSFGFCQLI